MSWTRYAGVGYESVESEVAIFSAAARDTETSDRLAGQASGSAFSKLINLERAGIVS